MKKNSREVHDNNGKIAPQPWHMENKIQAYKNRNPAALFEGPSGLLNPQTPGGKVNEKINGEVP